MSLLTLFRWVQGYYTRTIAWISEDNLQGQRDEEGKNAGR
jgi:hypothetical protein